jgi:hypothetical protein
MGNHRMEQCRPRINTTPPIMPEVVVVETWRNHVGVVATQSLYVSTRTT